MTKQEQDVLIDECTQEGTDAMAQGVMFALELNFMELQFLVANLQLAQRHPGNNGRGARFTRQLLDGCIERIAAAGFEHTAGMLRLGNDPDLDEPVRILPSVPCVKAFH